MKKTCREAYDIYTQYNSISNDIYKKVNYLIKIINVYKNKERFGLVDMNTLVLYSEKSIGSDTLSHEQCGRIIHSFSEIKIINIIKKIFFNLNILIFNFINNYYKYNACNISKKILPFKCSCWNYNMS